MKATNHVPREPAASLGHESDELFPDRGANLPRGKKQCQVILSPFVTFFTFCLEDLRELGILQILRLRDYLNPARSSPFSTKIELFSHNFFSSR